MQSGDVTVVGPCPLPHASWPSSVRHRTQRSRPRTTLLCPLLLVLIGASTVAGQSNEDPAMLAIAEYEDVTSCPVTLFRQANGSTYFAAGQYQVRYVRGCWRLGEQWTVGEPLKGSDTYISWLLTDANERALVPASLGFSSAMSSPNETECAAAAQQDLEGVLLFNHTGGEIGIFTTACQTAAAAKRSNGAPNPTWQLEAAQPEEMGSQSPGLPALLLPSLRQCTSLQVGFDLWGNDLLDCPDSPLQCRNCGYFNVSDAATCEQMCARHPTCGAFLFKARGECRLKPASGFVRKPCEDCYSCVLPAAAAALPPAPPDIVGATESMAPTCGRVFRGTDFEGGDLQTCSNDDPCWYKCQYVNVANMAACCDLCSKNVECKAVTFLSDGPNGPDSVGMCFLKGILSSINPKNDSMAFSAYMAASTEQPAALSPSPAVAAPAGTSSSAVGAIVGGVCGGLAVLAVLAFLALRPGSGWLRRPSVRSAPASGHAPQAGKGWQPATVSGSSGPADVESNGDAVNRGADRRVGSLPPASRLSHWSVSTPDAVEGDAILGYINSQVASRASTATSASGASRRGAGAGAAAALPTGVQQWEVQWGDLQVERLLGRGAFGRVYLAYWRKQPVATKVLITRCDDLTLSALELPEATMRELQQEAATMASMRHPHIVQFLGLCTYPPCLVTELCSRGSLYDVLRNAARQPELAAALTWRLRLRMAAEAARGILYLHSHSPPMLHRDIKSPNLLVDEEWHIKVSDFGLCKIMQEQAAGSQTSTEGVTNPTWLAPEVLRAERATTASDVYSFGLVLLELMTWRLPWAGVAGFAIAHTVLKGSRPDVPPPEELPGPDAVAFTGLPVYCQLMRECWAQEPVARPAFDDIVERLQELLEGESGAC